MEDFSPIFLIFSNELIGFAAARARFYRNYCCATSIKLQLQFPPLTEKGGEGKPSRVNSAQSSGLVS